MRSCKYLDAREVARKKTGHAQSLRVTYLERPSDGTPPPRPSLIPKRHASFNVKLVHSNHTTCLGSARGRAGDGMKDLEDERDARNKKPLGRVAAAQYSI